MDPIRCPECGCLVSREAFVCPVCARLLMRPSRARDGGLMAHIASEYDREMLASREESPPWLLRELGCDPSHLVRRRVAANAAAPPDAIAALARENPAWVAANPALSEEAMNDLLDLPEGMFNAEAPLDGRPHRAARLRRSHLLRAQPEAAVSRAVEVRRELARNPSLTTDLFTALSRDADAQVRRNVAANGHAPAEVLEALADDADATVAEAVAQNPATPLDVAKHLVGDARWSVRAALAAGPHAARDPLPAVLMLEDDSRVLAAASANPLTPEDLLRAFADHAEAFVRAAVAGNPATPPAVLLALAADADGAVRWQVCNNPASPADALRILVDDADGWIAHCAKKAISAATRVSDERSPDVENR